MGNSAGRLAALSTKGLIHSHSSCSKKKIVTKNVAIQKKSAFLCNRDRSSPGAGAKGQGCEELPPTECLRLK